MSFWTVERAATLRKLVADGQSASQIARRLGGITRNAVQGKCARLGLQLAGRQLSTSFVERVEEARKSPVAVGDQRRKRRGCVVMNAPEQKKFKRGELKAVAETLSATIADLAADACPYPYGDRPPFARCGRPLGPHGYCDEHRSLMRQPGSALSPKRAASMAPRA